MGNDKNRRKKKGKRRDEQDHIKVETTRCAEDKISEEKRRGWEGIFFKAERRCAERHISREQRRGEKGRTTKRREENKRKDKIR